MDVSALLDGLVTFLCFLPVLTLHEFAHAWVAWKCGDDTARLQGRVTLNPAAHIDPVGTLIIPGAIILLSAMQSSIAGFLIGWGKPVPVNPYRLNNQRRDDTLVSLAGPGMNIVLALGMFFLARLGHLAHSAFMIDLCLRIATVSVYLAFFNLLPLPPLDGSHVLKNLTSMSDEAYWKLCQFGFILIIVAIQIPLIQHFLQEATLRTLTLMAWMVGFA